MGSFFLLLVIPQMFVVSLIIKTCKNKLVECFKAYGIINGEQINVLHRNPDRLAACILVG